jgi:D-lyxose ketol-isomerase
MITKKEFEDARSITVKAIRETGIEISPDEIDTLSVADFGLSNLKEEGGQILTFFNTERIAAKVIYLCRGQTLPEHWHPKVGNDIGKEEVLRCVKGIVRVGIPGENEISDDALPAGKAGVYTCRKEVLLKPGEQIILKPGLKHWFQSVNGEAVMFSFSSCVRDLTDHFTDPKIIRETVIR